MEKPTDLPTPLSPFDEIRFVAEHRPGMEAGDYRIDVSQSLATKGETHLFPSDPDKPTSTRIAVMGDRFDLQPNVMHSMYPPANARGDFWHVLPHVILSRSTLPWERSACDDLGLEAPPWMALLVFDEEDMADVKCSSVKAKELQKTHAGWPKIKLQTGQHDDDTVSVFDVPWERVKDLLPRHRSDFGYRTHTRRVFPHRLKRRTHLLGAEFTKVLRDLDRVGRRTTLIKFFAREGIVLGDAKTVVVERLQNDHLWRVISPTAGSFMLTHERSKTGDWLRVQGGLKAEAKAKTPPVVYDFAALRLSAGQLAQGLAKRLVPKSSGNMMTLRKRVVEPVVLPTQNLPDALLSVMEGLSEAATIKRDAGARAKAAGDVGPEYWRVTDLKNDVHFLLKLVAVEDDEYVDVDDYGPANQEQAVIVANRLPMPNSKSTVHLVSLENRYDQSGKDCVLSAPTAKTIRLVSLKSWDFYCLADKPDFKTLLEQVNLKDDGSQAGAVLRLPDRPADAAPYLDAGYVPLKHHMRQGQKTVSWYKGPFVPKAAPHDEMIKRLPTRCADVLLQYDHHLGMLDASYGAAWELGRLITLANTSLATKLFHWKRAHAQHLNAARHVVDFGGHIAQHSDHMIRTHRALESGLPQSISKWFDELSMLRHVPFNYLVPDEKMLPCNSIRFFDIDPTWVDCLRDGAFSIGRVLAKDTARPEHSIDHLPKAEPFSGFLLRSEVVTDYTDFTIDAYGTAVGAKGHDRVASHLPPKSYHPLPCVRREVIGRGLLLCLFRGDVRMIDMHMRPEVLHFGLDIPDHVSAAREPSTLVKNLRRDDGEQITASVALGAVANLVDGKTRVVDMTSLATSIHAALGKNTPNAHTPHASEVTPSSGLNPAIFALEMLAAADLVRFVRQE